MSILRFAISASHGGSHLLEGANQFVATLSSALGAPIKLWVSADYDHLARAIADSMVTLAWAPPLVQARAGSPCAVALRDGELTYRSAILVRADSAARTVADLPPVRAAWVDASSSGGYLFARLHLSAAGVQFAEERFVGSYSRACAAVAEGSADLCACFVSEAAVRRKAAVADISANFGWVADRLRLLAVTDSIPPDGIVLSPKLDRERQVAITRALTTLHETPAGQKALATLLRAERLVAPPADLLAMLDRLRKRVP